MGVQRFFVLLSFVYVNMLPPCKQAFVDAMDAGMLADVHRQGPHHPLAVMP